MRSIVPAQQIPKNGSPWVYLASQSPRRRSLLEQLKLRFEIIQVDCDETQLPNESPQEMVQRLALAKAKLGWQQIKNQQVAPVIGADTIVVVDNQIFGKPVNVADAAAMLQQLSGKTHQVFTAVAVVKEETQKIVISKNDVTFRQLSDQDIQTYIATKEPMGKAGAYAIQGRAALFISHLQGSFSGVMGLPLYELGSILREFNMNLI